MSDPVVSSNVDTIKSNLNNSKELSNYSRESSNNSNNSKELPDEFRKKITTRGLSGLVNIGNTCYMNATLQCLVATDLLAGYFIKNQFCNDLKHGTINKIIERHKKKHDDKKDTIRIKSKSIVRHMKNTLTYKFRTLIAVMWSENARIKPLKFKETLGKFKSIYSGCEQNDSQELLNFILDQIHEETKTDVIIESSSKEIDSYAQIKKKFNKLMNSQGITDDDRIRYKEEFLKYQNDNLKEMAIYKAVMYWNNFLKKNHSVIIDIFTGLAMTETKCFGCNFVNFKFDPFNIISLPIPISTEETTLDYCLSKYFTTGEHLKDDNKYQCENCPEKQEAITKSYIWHSPARLIIQLKRFSFAGRMSQRINTIVKFPFENLDLSKYVSEHKNQKSIYDLYAIIRHSGGVGFGHYVSYAKNSINEEWYLFDDQNVVHIDHGKIEKIVSDSGPYVLFYKKRGNIELTPCISDDDMDI